MSTLFTRLARAALNASACEIEPVVSVGKLHDGRFVATYYNGLVCLDAFATSPDDALSALVVIVAHYQTERDPRAPGEEK